MKFNNPIYVTMPTLAPLSEVDVYLMSIWQSGVMTHNGPLVRKFEKDFSAWADLHEHHIVAVCNGTMAIQLALRALNLPKGAEIITTPFTFIATISSILYEGFKPIFVDIDKRTLNIDPCAIEAAISEKTAAIIPVHVFGNPCDVNAIDRIAKKHNLRTIYDAAHAVGVKCNGKSILKYGDVSATSFHATKLLNTSEGGGVYADDPQIDEQLRKLRFFGYNAEKDVDCVGTNAKMTEVNAAIGLANLRYLDEIISDRRDKYALYRNILAQSSHLTFQQIEKSCNCSYFPLILESEEMLLKVDAALKEINVFARRYFYPVVNSYKTICPNAKMCSNASDIASRILCLPLYKGLSKEAIAVIAERIIKTI